jgi:crotonobetainyl-CoA:carnitine CoA-transferase CaiB-like acyl-CoA transferase
VNVPERAPSFLDGITVVEVPGEYTFYAGALLAMFGADVVVVEPPGGHPHRRRGPLVAEQPDGDGLFWLHFYRGRRSMVIDLDAPSGREELRSLLEGADVFLSGDDSGALEAGGLTFPAVQATLPGLIWTSVTAFGAAEVTSAIPATDLTLMAGAGPIWSCGYDDHDVPPVRPGEHHAAHTAGVFATIATLAALWERCDSGLGQFVDVSASAALNVTTEAATFTWLVAQETVQRMTGRHAAVEPSEALQIVAADGRMVQTGHVALTPALQAALLSWLDELELGDGLAATLDTATGVRDALRVIAEHLTSRDFFLGAQARGIPAGVLLAPEDLLEDEHVRARGFIAPMFYEELGRAAGDAGAPFRASATPCVVDVRAPRRTVVIDEPPERHRTGTRSPRELANIHWTRVT